MAAGDKLSIRRAATGEELLTLRLYSHHIVEMAFSPDGTRLATAGGEDQDSLRGGGVKLWDLAAGQEVLSLGGSTEVVTHVAFSPDGQRLVSAQLRWRRPRHSRHGPPILRGIRDPECLPCRRERERFRPRYQRTLTAQAPSFGRIPCASTGWINPFSVMIPAINGCGVTSNAGLYTLMPSGAVCRPKPCVISRESRCSMGMPSPVGKLRSNVLDGAATAVAAAFLLESEKSVSHEHQERFRVRVPSVRFKKCRPLSLRSGRGFDPL